MKRYSVVINASDEGYSVACPALPGCWSQGRTKEEAVANIIEAIGDYLAETALAAGATVPSPAVVLRSRS